MQNHQHSREGQAAIHHLSELPVQLVQKSQPVRDACPHHSAARRVVLRVGHQEAESRTLLLLHDKVVLDVGDYEDQLDEQTMTMNTNAFV